MKTKIAAKKIPGWTRAREGVSDNSIVWISDSTKQTTVSIEAQDSGEFFLRILDGNKGGRYQKTRSYHEAERLAYGYMERKGVLS